jgi:hypothetical protein
MAHKTFVDKETLSLIANGEYEHRAPHSAVEKPILTNAEYLELFKVARLSAGKIIERAQDHRSKSKLVGSFESKVSSTKLELDVRKFTIPIAMGVFNSKGSVLLSRVTVTEHYRRTAASDAFHLTGLGAIGVKLFVTEPEDLEQTMHSVFSQQCGKTIEVKINNIRTPPAESMAHVISLLELTRSELDAQ